MRDRKLANEYVRRGLGLAPNDPRMLYKRAVVHQLFGETGQALTTLQEARHAGYAAQLVRDDPAFDSMKGDPRFEAILSQK